MLLSNILKTACPNNNTLKLAEDKLEFNKSYNIINYYEQSKAALSKRRYGRDYKIKRHN
jgi:hypothetical protein